MCNSNFLNGEVTEISAEKRRGKKGCQIVNLVKRKIIATVEKANKLRLITIKACRFYICVLSAVPASNIQSKEY